MAHVTKRRRTLLGLTIDDAIKAFFGGNALVSLVVLALITLFLVKEGAGFFGQERNNLTVYRKAGLELVDLMRERLDAHTALTRYLSDVRLREVRHLQSQGKSIADINTALEGFDGYSDKFADVVGPLRGMVRDLAEVATGIKDSATGLENRKEERRFLLAAGKTAEAAAVTLTEVDFGTALKPILDEIPAYKEAGRAIARDVTAMAGGTPVMTEPDVSARMIRFRELALQYAGGFPAVEQQVDAWDYRLEVPASKAFSSFLLGRKWVTASAWQDWYGVIPLLTGSVLVSIVALCLAIPFGVGAAIYVNQVASRSEQRFIKPGIEFISAFPSVVIGFFGIAILGETLRQLSAKPWLSWVPGFPYSERLNIITAGCLLGLIAVPTIFSLAEDAINNVPIAFREASMALGASRLQTVLRIIVPASLSGIISAVLLGLGRVIGETMVVLLCAGNRIAIPDFTQGLAALTEPVHTMTGIIAQEMGEVPNGSIHYRALFMVGLLLFVISLCLNFTAQKIVRRYRWVRT